MRVKDLAHDDVARRAYELFLSRGQAHGRDLDDWLEAERQVRRSSPAVAAPVRNGRRVAGRQTRVASSPGQRKTTH